MTFAKPHEHRCAKCGKLFHTNQAGAKWTNRKGNPRYVHPGCDQPKKDWKPA